MVRNLIKEPWQTKRSFEPGVHGMNVLMRRHVLVETSRVRPPRKSQSRKPQSAEQQSYFEVFSCWLGFSHVAFSRIDARPLSSWRLLARSWGKKRKRACVTCRICICRPCSSPPSQACRCSPTRQSLDFWISASLFQAVWGLKVVREEVLK